MCNSTCPTSDAPGVKGQHQLNAQKRVVDFQETISVVILDWDNTLFPTSALMTYGPDRLKEAFEIVDTLVADLFQVACATPQTQVVLLTNARVGWITHCVQNFLPKVNAFLEVNAFPGGNRMAVVSAKPTGEQDSSHPDYVAQVAKWKINAVHEQLRPGLFETLDNLNVRALQVLSIGDNPHDLDAGHAANAMLRSHASAVRESFVKTILLKPDPTVSDLIGELRSLTKSFQVVISNARSCHHSLSKTTAPYVAAQSRILSKPAADVTTAGKAPTQEAAPISSETSVKDDVQGRVSGSSDSTAAVGRVSDATIVTPEPRMSAKGNAETNVRQLTLTKDACESPTIVADEVAVASGCEDQQVNDCQSRSRVATLDEPRHHFEARNRFATCGEVLCRRVERLQHRSRRQADQRRCRRAQL